MTEQGVWDKINSLHGNWYFTGNIVYKNNDFKRHYLRDGDKTRCNMEVNGNWVFGDVHPPVSIDYYCPKCFPTKRTSDNIAWNKFHIIQGQVVVDSHNEKKDKKKKEKK